MHLIYYNVAASKVISFLVLKIHIGRKHWNEITYVLLSVCFCSFCQYRIVNHKILIEYGRWNNIQRHHRFCHFFVILKMLEINNIHLFSLHTWDMKICSSEKSHISRGKYDYFEGEQISMSPLCKGNECFIPPGQRFGEFCQMKSFGHLCLQNYYFGTSLELFLLTWNTVIWPKRISNKGNTILLRRKYDVVEREIRCIDKCHVGLFRPIEFLYK